MSEDPIEEDINPRPVIREREKKRDFERRLNYWFTNSNERRQYNKWIQDTDFTFSFESWKYIRLYFKIVIVTCFTIGFVMTGFSSISKSSLPGGIALMILSVILVGLYIIIF